MFDLILKLKEEIPVLVVTHRVRPALLADEVLILDQGKLVEVGAPKLLIEGDNLLSVSIRDLMRGL